MWLTWSAGTQPVTRTFDGTRTPGSSLKQKLHRSDHAVRLAFKALDDFGDDLGRAGASHREIDQRLVSRNSGDLRGQGEFILRDERAREIVLGWQLDAGKLGRLRNEGNVAAPELEDRVIAWNPKVFGGTVDRVEKSVPDPEVDELQHGPVCDRFQWSGPDVIRHACAVAKEVRQPGRLHDPDEGCLENPARHRDGNVGAGDDRGRLKLLETGQLVLDALDQFRISEGGRKLLATVHFGDELDLFLREAGLHPRQGKPVLFDHALEVAAVGDEMNIEDLAGCGMALDGFGDLDHPARFRQIVRTGRKEKSSFGHHVVPPGRRLIQGKNGHVRAT